MSVAQDLVMRWLDLRGFRAVRREICSRAVGDVLEIGAGTGTNLRHLRHARTLTVLDPDERAGRTLSRRANRLGLRVGHHVGVAERLPFADARFDTVIVALTLCSVDDPSTALAEIRRVLRPGGTLTFAEHVRSQDPTAAARQDRMNRLWHAGARGCNINRDTLAEIRAAGFAIDTVRRGALGGAPSIARPLIVGVAKAPGGVGSGD